MKNDYLKRPSNQKTLQRCEELKKWVEENGKFPSGISKNHQEKCLRSFMNNMRAAKHGKCECVITEKHQEILDSIPGWAWKTNRDSEKTFKRCVELKEWVEENGRLPNVYRYQDRKEKGFADLVRRVRSVKKGKSKGSLPDFVVEVLESISGWEWTKGPSKTITRCYELKEWVEVNGKIPRPDDKDKHIRSLGLFVNTMKQAKKGRGRSIFTEEHSQALESIPGWTWDTTPRRYQKPD